MNKKFLLILLVMVILFISTACNKEYKQNNNIGEEIDSVKIMIDEKEYIINLENNETVNAFLGLLPLEFTMNELNGNEKYVYIGNYLNTNPYNPKHIEKGDVMLYGNDCLVIFYKSFDTTYNYTKIGHIDNLPDLGNGNVKVKINR